MTTSTTVFAAATADVPTTRTAENNAPKEGPRSRGGTQLSAEFATGKEGLLCRRGDAGWAVIEVDMVVANAVEEAEVAACVAKLDIGAVLSNDELSNADRTETGSREEAAAVTVHEGAGKAGRDFGSSD